MWRPRDRERFIGSYDPEREMPDPDRTSGDRWQSDAYRRGARDTRFAYRFNPDSFEERHSGQRRDVEREWNARWPGDARDREFFERGYQAGRYDRENERAWRGGDRSFDRGWRGDDRSDFDRGWRNDFDRDRDFDRGGFMTGPRLDRDQPYGADRGWDVSDDFDRGWRRDFDDRDRDRGPWRR